MLTLYPLQALTDNYIWIMRQGQQIWVIDPGEDQPLSDHILREQLTLRGILLTHRHIDHWLGVPRLIAQFPVPVWGPIDMPSPIQALITRELQAGDILNIDEHIFEVLAVPGHTAEHIAYFCAAATPPIALVGDTLFAGGCGRPFFSLEALFESLQQLAQLPTDTLLYCSHEYTLSNLKFAQAADPDNPEVKLRLESVRLMRQKNLPTLPTTLSLELTTNPFMRLGQPGVKKAAELASNSTLNCDFAVFSALRGWKNRY